MSRAELRKIAFKHISIQLSAILVMTPIVWAADSLMGACSFLLGGLACLLPAAYFSWRISKHSGAQNTKMILKDFYQGEMIKLMLTGAIFLLIFKFIPVTIMAVFIGFITAQSAFWVSCFILRSERAVT